MKEHILKHPLARQETFIKPVENPVLAPIELLAFMWLIVLNDKKPFLGPYLSLNCLWLLWGDICTSNSGTHQVDAQPAWPNSAALGQEGNPQCSKLQRGEEL